MRHAREAYLLVALRAMFNIEYEHQVVLKAQQALVPAWELLHPSWDILARSLLSRWCIIENEHAARTQTSLRKPQAARAAG